MKRFGLNIGIMAVIALLLSVATSLATDRWSYTTKGQVNWLHISQAGTLLYATDEGLYSLDPETGKLAWSREEFKKIPEFSFVEIESTPLLLIADNSGTFQKNTRLVAVDAQSGQTVWETEKLKGSVIDLAYSVSHDLALMFVSETPGLRAKVDITGLTLSTGEVVFNTPLDEKVDLYIADKSSRFAPKFDLSGHARPTFEGDSVYLAFGGIHKLDLKTGKILWESAFDVTEKAFSKTNASPLVSGDLVYSSAKGVIRAFDKNSGQLKWTSADYGAGVAEMTVVDGVLYGRMGGTFYETNRREYQLKKPLGVIALDSVTGTPKWKYDGAKESITNLALIPEQSLLLIADHKDLIALDLKSSGNVKEAYKIPMEFKAKKIGAGGKVARIGMGALGGGVFGALKASKGRENEDPPISILRRDDGQIIVRGKQNVLSFDPSTKKVNWGSSFDAPGISGWEKLAVGAVFAMMYAVETAHAARTQAGTSENTFANSARRDIMSSWSKMLNKRFTAGMAKSDTVYILTDIKNDEGKGAGLVAVSLKDGEAGASALFKDKEPLYEVDEMAGVVYRVHKGANKIVATELR
jgi:outer membrane protein assembly factor BamB